MTDAEFCEFISRASLTEQKFTGLSPEQILARVKKVIRKKEIRLFSQFELQCAPCAGGCTASEVLDYLHGRGEFAEVDPRFYGAALAGIDEGQVEIPYGERWGRAFIHRKKVYVYTHREENKVTILRCCGHCGRVSIPRNIITGKSYSFHERIARYNGTSIREANHLDILEHQFFECRACAMKRRRLHWQLEAAEEAQAEIKNLRKGARKCLNK